MEIEFDPIKNAENIRKHGVSMERAVDFVAIASIEDDRFDYDETRIRAYGHINGVAHCIVFTIRNETIRVISLRRAHAKEMKRYAP